MAGGSFNTRRGKDPVVNSMGRDLVEYQARIQAQLSAQVGLTKFASGYSATVNDRALAFTGTVAATAILPRAADVGAAGSLTLPISNRGTATLTVAARAGEKVNGAASVNISAGSAGIAFSDGQGWKVIT